jgi:hypothetical protein
MRDEIVEMVGQGPYDTFVALVAARQETWLPHPALKMSAAKPT